MVKPYYTSNTLIESVKRRMAFPIAQVTFSNEDILALANEELFLAQVPSIMQFHEEYFVFDQIVPLLANKSKYPIPNRAIGMKLRDVTFKDDQGNLSEMSKINPDDKSFFGGSNSSSRNPTHYYIQNNSIIITPEVSASPVGSLVFTYYLRPNSLVPDERAVICGSFSKTITVENASLVTGDSVLIGSTTLVADTDFPIGVNSATTANSIVTALSGIHIAVASSNIITVSFSDRNLSFSTSNPAGLVIPTTITINSTQPVPTDIVSGSLVDFLQTDGGHSTLAFDVILGNNSVSASSLTLLEFKVPEDFVVGDYVCAQYECIVPQVPTDLHNLLAERTCARILEAQGDGDGLKNANAKIQELEARQATIIDSRVDGSPMKILNTHSLLRYGKTSRRSKD